MARIALNDENIELRIATGKEILDRAYGKPRQQLDGLAEDRLEEKIRHREEFAPGAGRKTPRPAAMPDAAKAPPELYLAALARLQARKPGEVSDAEWRQAIDDAGLFLDKWGKIAADRGWTARDLFDAPCLGVPGGLIWFTRGEPVASIGPWHASIGEVRQKNPPRMAKSIRAFVRDAAMTREKLPNRKRSISIMPEIAAQPRPLRAPPRLPLCRGPEHHMSD